MRLIFKFGRHEASPFTVSSSGNLTIQQVPNKGSVSRARIWEQMAPSVLPALRVHSGLTFAQIELLCDFLHNRFGSHLRLVSAIWGDPP